MRTKLAVTLAFLLLLVPLTACGGTPASTPTPTAEPTPTVAVTPEPTLEPTPEPTPEPPKLLTATVGDVSFEYYDDAVIDKSADAISVYVRDGDMLLVSYALQKATVSTMPADEFSSDAALDLYLDVIAGQHLTDAEVLVKERLVVAENTVIHVAASGLDGKGSTTRIDQYAFQHAGSTYQLIALSSMVNSEQADAMLQEVVHSLTFNAPTLKWYSASEYRVGTDIPAGEYYLRCSGNSAYMAVSSDSSGNSIIENENFTTHHFITLEDGQYFELSRGRALSVDQFVPDFDATDLDVGMYRVGTDIPAGEYKLENTSSSRAYCCVYNNSTAQRSIVTNDNFEGSKYITVQEGQYLLLNRCTAALVN